MKKPLLIALSLLLCSSIVVAQQKIKDGTINNSNLPNKDALLDLESNNKGLLHARVSLVKTTDATPLTAHVEGMMVYNTATVNDVVPGIYYNDGSKWIFIKSPAGTVNVEGQPGKTGQPGTPGQPGGPGAGVTIVTNDSGTWVYNATTNTWTNINGPKGDKGDKGDAGVVGVQGLPGTSGTPGTPGSGQPGAPGSGITVVTNDSGTWVYNATTNTWTNINGPKGDKGDAGVVGVQGLPGTSGTPGTPGSGQPGAPGAGITVVNNDSGTWVYNPTTNTWTNINGPKGDKGDAGVVGVQGLPGTSGTPGTPGSGQPGAPGASITVVTNDSGTWVYNPTTNTWTNINGAKGDKGDAGVVGVQGLPGTSGTPGTPGSGQPGAPGAGITVVTNDSGTWVYNPTTNTWTNINGQKGDKGDKGDAGVVGVQGLPGTSGTPGTPGSGQPGAPGAGITVVTNDSGTWVYNPTTNTWTNINGPKGDKGDKGDAGVVGVQGLPGTSGTPGTPGSGQPGAPGAGITVVTNDSGTWVYNPTTNTWTNINGPKGDKGDAGVVGVQGLPGTSGTPGTPGSGQPGAPGAGITVVTNDSGTWVYNPTTNTWTNINGPKGDKGDKGDAGVVGVQGLPGTSGTPGTPGSGQPGAPGAGITVVTNDSGTWVYNLTTNTWTNINGPKGDKGDAGVVGVQGLPGTSGTPGTPGSGQPGAPGAGITVVTNDSGTWVYNPTTNTWTNINGAKGDKGDAGVVGVQGLPGTSGTPGTPGSGQPGAPGTGITVVTNDSGTWVYNPTTNTWTKINGPKGDKGDKGDIGATGAQGPKGDKGDTGATGATGAQGLKGDKGDKGDTGAIGAAGAAGATGAQGPKGDAGIQGLKGDKGDKGDIGATGAVGATGAQGPKGDTGIQGLKGDKGDKGDIGATGAAGATGAQGLKGDKGDKGDTGPEGAAGVGGVTTVVAPLAISGAGTTASNYKISAANATSATVGVVKPGTGLSVATDGALSVDPTAISTGKAITATGITVSGGANSVLRDVALTVKANNGLSVGTAPDDNVQLGGTLTKTTTIATSGQTLNITGLPTGAATDNLLVSSTGGQLKTIAATTLATEPWFNQTGGTQATANTQNIYQMGSVAVGAATIPTFTAGTETITPKFHVAGDISTTGKIWTANSVYADYVFEKYFKGHSAIKSDYQFRSLAYVKDFIMKNSHLPGVSAIGDLKKGSNGYTFDMTELSIQSLEKIEELYLHTIEQKEKIDRQQAELNEMKARLERIEKLLLDKK